MAKQFQFSAFVLLLWINLTKCTGENLIGGSNSSPPCIHKIIDDKITVVCHIEERRVADVIQTLPADTERLRFELYSNWNGKLPKPQETVNVPSLYKLSQLKYLAFQSSRYGTERMITTNIHFDVDTFKNITELQAFIINIPLFEQPKNQSLANMVKHFKHLETLDLSDTKFLSFSSINDTIKALPYPRSLKQLKLSRFQNIGSPGYSQVVNISDLCFDLSELEVLDLSKNNFGIILPGIIATLPKLKWLDISYNSLAGSDSDAIYWDILLHNKLEYVNISNQINSELLDSDVIQEQMNQVDQLTYTETTRQAFESIAVQCANLVDAGNISNLLQNTTLICHLFRCVIQYAFKVNFFEHIPCSAFDLITFDFQCYLFVRAPLFLNLHTLRADNLNWIITFSYSLHGTVCFNQNTSLSNITFANNKRWIGNFRLSESLNSIDISGVNNVTSIDLSNNDLALKLPTTDNKYPYLQHYNLAGNRVQLENKSLCKNWPNLQHFNLSSNNIENLYVNIFEDCHHMQVLDLSLNKFKTITITLTGLSNLQYLDISNNLLSYLSNDVIQYLDRLWQHHNTSHTNRTILNAVSNPYICNCSADSLNFIDWIIKTVSRNIKNWDTMYCSGYEGRKLIKNVDVAEMEKLCNPSYVRIIVTTVSATLLILIFFTSVGVTYRFRWKIRYLMFKINQKLSKKKPMTMNEIEGKSYKYDIFVTYCSTDRFWVHDVLMKTLENDYGFKLCIHYRDFPVGEWIVDAITQNMRDSREIIVVVSEASLKTPWVQFELEVAYSEAVNRNAKVILIKLENITQPVDSPAILWILENRVHLEWSDNKEGKKLFWNKLVSLLYGDADGGGFCCCKFGLKAVRPEQLGRGITDEARQEQNEPLLRQQ